MKLTSRILQTIALLTLSLPLLASPIDANAFSGGATIINFDELAGGNCNGCGTQVTTQYSLFGVVFVNPTFPGEATAQTNLTSGMLNATAPNILWIHQGGLITDPNSAPLQLLFSTAVNRVGMDYASSSDAFLLLQAYNGNQLVDTEVFIGSPTATGLSGFAGLQTQQAITRLDVSYHPFSDPTRSFNFAVDNVQFEAVPEPSTLWMGVIGLAGFAARRLSRGNYRSSRS